ncbi:hypothetical protein FQN52_007795 [Onygenales sp. PD_12]|nr:hypothetical protein FQN52_007795 [Onygenales sp. PD_12]
MSKPLSPSSADVGFILSPPPLQNPYTSDAVIQRILQWYLPSDIISNISPKLEKFGSEAISAEINSLIGNAETQQPYIKTRNVWGGRYDVDRLITSEGWRGLGKWGISNGVVALGYEDTFGSHRRIVQHAFNYLYSAASAAYSCPVSMTSGAARLIRLLLPSIPQDHPLYEIYGRLTARENNWISAQWMTERPGGSDVRNTETIAVYSPLPTKSGRFGRVDEGDYLLSGFKFFSSATDCNVALLLAKCEDGQLSLFVAPTRKKTINVDGQEEEATNGIHIHRLKNKMGTKELPTAELELKGVRAHMVGPKGRGVATIATLLNVTRGHNFITGLSCFRRALDIAKSFARGRTTIEQPLWTFPMHLRVLAQLEVKHRGYLQLAFFTTSLLSFADNGFPSHVGEQYGPLKTSTEITSIVLRALTSTSKAVICKMATLAFQDCQEAMGGVGYMDEPDEPEFNVSRLWRDTASNSVWEGTTNVLASETVRHLARPRNLNMFSQWIEDVTGKVKDDKQRNTLKASWTQLKGKIIGQDLGAALADGRQIMFTLAWVASGVLLALDAQRDGDKVACEVARRWVLCGEGVPGEFAFPAIVQLGLQMNQQARSETEGQRRNWDCLIVWGCDLPEKSSSGYRVEAKL